MLADVGVLLVVHAVAGPMILLPFDRVPCFRVRLRENTIARIIDFFQMSCSNDLYPPVFFSSVSVTVIHIHTSGILVGNNDLTLKNISRSNSVPVTSSNLKFIFDAKRAAVSKDVSVPI